MVLLFTGDSTDESATEATLKSLQAYASMCGQMELNTPRDAFITAVCKASLPAHYALQILNSQISSESKGISVLFLPIVSHAHYYSILTLWD